MDNAKPWYASKGVIGSVIAMMLSIIAFFNGIAPDNLDVPQELIDQLKDEEFINSLLAIGTFIAGFLAFIGRLMAKKPVKL